jgi:uncharacterized membrane protein YccC
MNDPKVKLYWARKDELRDYPDPVPADIEFGSHEVVVLATAYDSVAQERDQLRKQVEEQKQWMRHKQTCVYYAAWDGTVPPCSCGLSAYLGEG